MADNYDIAIRVDPGAAVPLATSIATALGKAEEAGARAGAAIGRGMRESSLAIERTRDEMGRFGSSARQAAAAVDRTRSALEAQGSSLAQLMGGLGRTSLAFEGLSQAIGREQAMLDKINGPSRRYEQHLQTLDSLLAKDRISTEQYAEQVKKLNRELERGSTIKPTPAPAAPASSGILGAASGSVKGLAAAAGVLGAREVLSMANGYQELQNRMRVVVGEGESVTQMFRKVDSVAVATRSNLESTTIAYQRLKNATGEMGLSSDDLLRVTERINKAIKVSGAAADESAAAMRQLAQGIASGRLQGDELRSVLENTPYVAKIIADSLGVTIGKLRELGSQGKLTSSVVINAFESMGEKIDKDFGKTVPTLSEQWGVLKDRMTLAVGAVFESTGAFQALGDAVQVVGVVVGAVGDVTRGLRAALDGVTGAMGPLDDVVEGVVNPTTLLSAAFLGLTNPITLLLAAGPLLKEVFDGAAVAGKALGDAIFVDSATERARAYLAEMDALKRLHGEYEKLEQAQRTIATARAAGIDVPMFDLEQAKRAAEMASNMKRWFGIEIPAAFDESTKASKALDVQAAKLKEQRGLDEQAEQAKRLERALRGSNAVMDEHAEHWKSITDKLVDVNGALAKIAQQRDAIAKASGKDPLIEMYGKGRQDWLDTTRQEVALTRQKRDLTDEVNNSEYKYGDTVVRLRKVTAEHKDDLESVNGAFRDGKISMKEWGDELQRLGVEEDKATTILKGLRQPLGDWSSSISALNLLLKQGRIDLEQYNLELGKLSAAQPTRLGELGRGSGYTGGRKIGGEEFAVGFDKFTDEQATRAAERRAPSTLEAMGIGTSIDTSWMDALIEKQRLAGGVLEDAAIKTAAWNQELELIQIRAKDDGFGRAWEKIRVDITDTAGALETTLVNAFHGAENALVSFVTTGEFGFKKMIDAMLADLTRLLIRQAATGLLGALGGGGISSVFGTGATQAFSGLFGSAPGFANGGEGRIPGSGPPDSRLFVARASPGEHYKFTPPGQPTTPAAAMPQATPMFQIVPALGDDAMDAYMERRGERWHLYFGRRDPAKRGSSTGR